MYVFSWYVTWLIWWLVGHSGIHSVSLFVCLFVGWLADRPLNPMKCSHSNRPKTVGGIKTVMLHKRRVSTFSSDCFIGNKVLAVGLTKHAMF
jgi:hypothetical protein